jgi:hypothetical protein
MGVRARFFANANPGLDQLFANEYNSRPTSITAIDGPRQESSRGQEAKRTAAADLNQEEG